MPFLSLSGNSRVLRNELQSSWHKKRMLSKPNAISRTNGFRKREREIFQKGEKGANETRIWENGIKRGAGVPEMPKAR